MPIARQSPWTRIARMREAFEDATSVDDIIHLLEARGPRFDPVTGETLIFLDEIQSCLAARLFLKEFTMDCRYDVIASGSLLDVPLKENRDASSTIPAGYEGHMRMYPLDFEEFLWAKGYRQDVIDRIKTSINRIEPIGSAMIGYMDEMFKEHMMVGGMPEVVSEYISGGIQHAVRALDFVVMSMYDDASKYASGAEALRIRRCFDSIPAQLAKSNSSTRDLTRKDPARVLGYFQMLCCGLTEPATGIPATG